MHVFMCSQTSDSGADMYVFSFLSLTIVLLQVEQVAGPPQTRFSHHCTETAWIFWNASVTYPRNNVGYGTPKEFFPYRFLLLPKFWCRGSDGE